MSANETKEKNQEKKTGRVDLSNVFTFEGKTYTSLDLDLENLTGKQMIEAAKEAKGIGIVNPVQEFCPVFLACVAAKAAKVPVDLIESLPAKDFTVVKTTVQNFLLQ